MARINLPLVGGRHEDRSLQVNSQRSINWYPSLEGDQAKGILTLLPTPGLSLVGPAGNGPCRSNFVTFQDNLYHVSGGQLIKMTTAEAFTASGTLNTSSGRCYLAAGRDYLLVVDGGDGYTWDGTTFDVIDDGGTSFPTSPTYCGVLDGYFIALQADSNQWNISLQEDPSDDMSGTNWPADQFSVAQAENDDAVAIATGYRDVYIIGETTTQVYYNSEDVDFTFSLYQNGVLEWGTPAPASVARTGGNIFMLGQEEQGAPTVIRMQGLQAQRIADHDIAYTLSQMTTYSDAEGFAYTEADQTFYELTFPTEDLTLVYHLEQRMWHERASNTMGRHRVSGHGRFNGKHYVGDYTNNNIYTLESGVYTEDGAAIRRVRKTAATHREGRLFEMNTLEIEFARGLGLATGQGSDPRAMLRYSRDGGRTWSSEIWRPMGKIGDYTRRAIWNQLGTMHDFRAEISVTDPIEAVIVSAYANVEVLVA